jgi:hypothetical protein
MNRYVEKNKSSCPFVNNPDDDCYCTKLMSEYTEKIIYYCRENYKKCNIYKRINKTPKHLTKKMEKLTKEMELI